MKKAIVLGALAVVLTLSGCGSQADGLIQQQIKLMNEMADAMENKDEAKLKDIESRMKTIGKQMEELKLSDADKKALEEKHKDAMMKAAGRMFSAAMKGGLPGVPGGGLPGLPEKDK